MVAAAHRASEGNSSIATKADFEYLFDKPYDDKRKVRVAGPFTVESLSPHRVPMVTAGANMSFKNHWIGIYPKGVALKPSR